MRYIEITKENGQYEINYVPQIKGTKKLKENNLGFLLIHNFLFMDGLESGEKVCLSKNGNFTREEIRDINNTFKIYFGAKNLDLLMIDNQS